MGNAFSLVPGLTDATAILDTEETEQCVKKLISVPKIMEIAMRELRELLKSCSQIRS